MEEIYSQMLTGDLAALQKTLTPVDWETPRRMDTILYFAAECCPDHVSVWLLERGRCFSIDGLDAAYLVATILKKKTLIKEIAMEMKQASIKPNRNAPSMLAQINLWRLKATCRFVKFLMPD